MCDDNFQSMKRYLLKIVVIVTTSGHITIVYCAVQLDCSAKLSCKYLLKLF